MGLYLTLEDTEPDTSEAENEDTDDEGSDVVAELIERFQRLTDENRMSDKREGFTKTEKMRFRFTKKHIIINQLWLTTRKEKRSVFDLLFFHQTTFA